MSNNKYEGVMPENALDKFRTFSYHHFLMATHNTEAIRVAVEDSSFFSIVKSNMHGAARSVEYDSHGKKTAPIVMIINSMVDSHYTIDGINYTTTFMPDSTSKAADGQLQIASQLTMRVREMYGINFMNFLADTAYDVLEVDTSNMVFLLKTVFVGHTHDGMVETIELDPYVLRLMTLSAAFDQSGGTYELSFSNIGLGAGFRANESIIKRNKQYTASNGTLGEMINDLQAKLNEECVQAFNAAGIGRLVQYQIEIPDEWKSYKVNGISKNYVEHIFSKEEEAQAVANKEIEEEADKSEGAKHVNGEVRITVQEMIRRILQLTEDLYDQGSYTAQKDATQKEVQDNVRLFKFETRSTSDDISLTLHYDVHPYYLPKLPADEDKSDSPSPGTASWFIDSKRTIPRYGMILDYLFTGKNTHIKQFDMNLSEGLMYMTNRKHNPNRALGATKNGVNINSSPKDARGVSKNLPTTETAPYPVFVKFPKDPVFVPDLPAENADGGTITTSAAATENRQIYLNHSINLYGSMYSVKVKIRGNPRLLSQTIRPIFPHDTEKYRELYRKRNEDAKKSIEQRNDDRGIESVGHAGKALTPNADLNGHYPMFVKFNIYTPNHDLQNVGQNYAMPHPFWYNGWYWIKSVSNSFTDGDFEQELELAAYTVFGIDKVKKA